MAAPTPVTLDVEGRKFKTLVSTLTRVPGCYFNDIFRDDDWQLRLNAEGNLFIDRDAQLFPVILGYLRDGPHFPLPQDEYHLDRLEQEAKFYRLPELVDLVEKQKTYAALPLSSRRPTTPPPPPPIPSKSRMRSKEILRRSSADETKAQRKSSQRKLSANAKGLQKEDIGEPSNFVHVVHIGWQEQVPPRINNHHMKLESTVQAVLRAMGYNDSDTPSDSPDTQSTTVPRRSASESNAVRLSEIVEEEPIYNVVEGHGAKSVAHQVIFTHSSMEMLPESAPSESLIPPLPPRVKKRAPPIPTKPQKSLFSQTLEPDEPKPTVRLAKYEKMPNM
uniref:CRIB domain-containing protein n=1 Tax=Plectus sambesii TaxID=2011161 RepID=A0A914UK60_9BILA